MLLCKAGFDGLCVGVEGCSCGGGWLGEETWRVQKEKREGGEERGAGCRSVRHVGEVDG